MTRNKPWTAVRKALVAVTVMLIVTLVLATGAAASEYEVLHIFTCTWAKNPMGNLTMDAAGNLYGTTEDGPGKGCGGGGCGTVYKLAPSANGTWKVSTLHVFTGADGANPIDGVIFDGAGNLYGTTAGGGAYGYGVGGGIYGYGVVFKLAPNPDGTWTESVLYNFGVGQADGREPAGELTFDGVGNLYGMTQYGGQHGAGTVFKLAPDSGGTWTESVLYSFTGNGQEWFPYAGLIFDAAGNLYGTTRGFSEGVVFKLTPDLDGTWTESVLFAFPAGGGAHHFRTEPLLMAG
ncbi:MAG: choice-of-anchor tandem repeat GloVer-containing protein [Candidatus Sulfotelmatobacter sp.]